MTKLALAFIMFLIACSFLSLTAATEMKCSEQKVALSKFRMMCTMDMATMCAYYKNGGMSQYRGSSSCACAKTGAEYVSYGPCDFRKAF